MSLGSTRPLADADIYNNPVDTKAQHCTTAWDEAWAFELQTNPTAPSMGWTLWRMFRWQYVFATLGYSAGIGLEVLNPILNFNLINYVVNVQSATLLGTAVPSVNVGIGLALGMFFTSAVVSLGMMQGSLAMGTTYVGTLPV